MSILGEETTTLYSIHDVAEIIGRKPMTVYGYINRGLLHPTRIKPEGLGPSLFIEPKELSRFISKHRKTKVVFR